MMHITQLFDAAHRFYDVLQTVLKRYIKRIFGSSCLRQYFCAGEMAERSNAAVLKTVEVQASGGSNPSLSANKKSPKNGLFFMF